MTLEATFSLTPRSSRFYSSSPSIHWANIYVYGAYFYPNYGGTYRYCFNHQHAEDEMYFSPYYAADPTLDLMTWDNRRKAPHIMLAYDLSTLGTNKELALIFGFDAMTESRLLVYSNAGLLGDETLNPGDNQFLMEIENLDYLQLFFFHSRLDGSSYGGEWFFKGITGYVI